jgi:hypothetical protein
VTRGFRTKPGMHVVEQERGISLVYGLLRVYIGWMDAGIIYVVDGWVIHIPGMHVVEQERGTCRLLLPG